MESPKILIVDDSRLSLQLMSALLQERRPAFEIETENRPSAALDHALSKAYGLIMLDLNMPEFSGEELAARMRENGCQARICFVTANVQKAVKERLEAQFGPVFNKPVNDALADTVLAYFDGA